MHWLAAMITGRKKKKKKKKKPFGLEFLMGSHFGNYFVRFAALNSTNPYTQFPGQAVA
jgi:hypothetical protein